MATEARTREQVIAALQAALVAGTYAGNARIRELAKQLSRTGKILEACGGATIDLDVNGRTNLGKILAGVSESQFVIHKSHGGGLSAHLRYGFNIVPPVNGQEFSIAHDAAKAAAEVLGKQLGVPAYAQPYAD